MASSTLAASRISSAAAVAMRAAIRLAGGREVCFACTLDDAGTIQTARVGSRGDAHSVLALPGVASRGEVLVPHQPSGVLGRPDPALDVAARIHDDGIGFGIIDNAVSDLYVVVEVPARAELSQLEFSSVDDDLGPDGAIARHLTR